MHLCFPSQAARIESGDLLILSGSMPVAYLVPARELASASAAPSPIAVSCLEGWVPWQALDAGLRHGARLESGDCAGILMITITHQSGLTVAVFCAPSSATVLPHLNGSEADFCAFPDGLYFHDGNAWQAAAVSWSDLLAPPSQSRLPPGSL